MAKRTRTRCCVEGCTRDWCTNGLCAAHLYRFRNGLPLDAPFRRYRSISIFDLYANVHINTRTGCHLWIGRTNRNGYGRVSVKNRQREAHRVAWELHNGPIPNGLRALHRCDVRNCINVEHLFIGTHDDNMADMASKGRHADVSGGKNPFSKLTDDDVAEIRKRAAKGEMAPIIAIEYDVSPSSIYSIVARRSWRHVT